MLDFDFSAEHVLMFMIAIFLLYHLVNNCGCMKDGFSVGGDKYDWPRPFAGKGGMRIGECATDNGELITSPTNCPENCIWIPEAKVYKMDDDTQIGRCRSLTTLNYLAIGDESNCSGQYMTNFLEGNKDISKIIDLNVGFKDIYEDGYCKQNKMCVPNYIDKLGWSQTRAPICEYGCEETRSPDGTDGWYEFGNFSQYTLPSVFYGCSPDGKKPNEDCIPGNRALCYKPPKNTDAICPSIYTVNCNAHIDNCDTMYSGNITDGEYHVCKKGDVGCDAGLPCSKKNTKEKKCPATKVTSCDDNFEDCNTKYSEDLFTPGKYHVCEKGTIFGCQAGDPCEI